MAKAGSTSTPRVDKEARGSGSGPRSQSWGRESDAWSGGNHSPARTASPVPLGSTGATASHPDRMAKAGGGEARPQPPPRHPSVSDPPGDRCPGGQPAAQQIQGEVAESQAFNPGIRGTGQAGVTRATRFPAARFQVNRCESMAHRRASADGRETAPWRLQVGGSDSDRQRTLRFGRNSLGMAAVEPVKIPTRTLGDRTDQHAMVGTSWKWTPRRQDPGAGKLWNSDPFIFILYLILHVYTWSKSQERISLVVQWLRTHLPMQGTQVRSLVREDSTSRGAAKSEPQGRRAPHAQRN